MDTPTFKSERHLHLVASSTLAPLVSNDVRTQLAQIKAELAMLRADARHKSVMLKAASFDINRILDAVLATNRLVLEVSNRTRASEINHPHLTK